MSKGFDIGKARKSKPKYKEHLDLLHKILKVLTKSNGKLRVVYPVLEMNIDKLDENFAQALRNWATPKLSPGSIDKEVAKTVEAIATFSDLMQELHAGRKANNLEIAIAGYEVIDPILSSSNGSLENWANFRIPSPKDI